MQTLSEIKALLAERGVRPKHRLGQNFLHDQNQIRKLLDAAWLGGASGATHRQDAGAASHGPGDPCHRPGDPCHRPLVLEVGPGTGTLTEALVEAGAEVVACEIDPDMAAILRSRLHDRITLIEGDVLARKHELNPRVIEAFGGRPFRLIANLPYGVASPLMMNLLVNHGAQCTGQFVTIQKEVADRLAAAPGTKAYGPLSIVAQALADVSLISTLSPSCFWPAPDVTSAMVAIRPRAASAFSDPQRRRAFARFVTQLFTKRRKQLGGVYGRERAYPAGITPDLRPEALSPSQVVALFESLESE